MGNRFVDLEIINLPTKKSSIPVTLTMCPSGDSDGERLANGAVEPKMIARKLQPMQRVFQRDSMQNVPGRIGSQLSRRPLKTESRIWLPTSDIRTRRVKNRIRQQSPMATPPFYGVKLDGQALVFDAWQIIRHAGINLDGSVLEFDTGLRPIGAYCPNYVAVDNDAENVKLLRRNGITAILGTIEGLPFPDNSFDYVLAFSPLIIRNTNDWQWINRDTNEVEVRSDYRKVVVGRAIQIARKKTLIASMPIAIDPPFADNAELVVTDPEHHLYYVVYAASQNDEKDSRKANSPRAQFWCP